MTFRRQVFRCLLLSAVAAGFGVASLIAPRADLMVAYLAFVMWALTVLHKEVTRHFPDGKLPPDEGKEPPGGWGPHWPGK